jgi:hypothetical protein
MDSASAKDLLWHLLLAIALILGVIAFHIIVQQGKKLWTRSRLEKWAKEHGLQLLEWQIGANFKGPFKWWITSGNHTVSRVKVREPDGRERSGSVLFGSFWVPFWLDDSDVACQWDE